MLACDDRKVSKSDCRVNPEGHQNNLRLSLELIFGKGMRTATFQFSESGGSVNGPKLFTELLFL